MDEPRIWLSRYKQEGEISNNNTIPIQTIYTTYKGLGTTYQCENEHGSVNITNSNWLLGWKKHQKATKWVYDYNTFGNTFTKAATLLNLGLQWIS